MKKKIETKILNPMLGRDFPLPDHATDGAAGLDVRACIDEAIILQPKDTALIPSGFALNINDPGIMAVLVARSGLGVKHGIVVAQAAGIIDSDYHGEVFVGLRGNKKNIVRLVPGRDAAGPLLAVDMTEAIGRFGPGLMAFDRRGLLNVAGGTQRAIQRYDVATGRHVVAHRTIGDGECSMKMWSNMGTCRRDANSRASTTWRRVAGSEQTKARTRERTALRSGLLRRSARSGGRKGDLAVSGL